MHSLSKPAGPAAGVGAGVAQSTAYKAGPTLGLGGSGTALDGGVRSRDIKREAERIMNELEIERRKKQLLSTAPAAQVSAALGGGSAPLLQPGAKSLLSPAAGPASSAGFLGSLNFASARATPPAALTSPSPAAGRFETRSSTGPTARVRHWKN